MISIYRIFESKSKSNLVNFVVQEHHAKKAGLHYDLRIERGGKLKSWATRKLPDLTAGNRIMLFPTPDHEMEWLTFSGRIDSGYGEGTVEIWDTGKCEIIKWEERKIQVLFHGNKLNGLYTFIPYKENWLLIKSKTS